MHNQSQNSFEIRKLAAGPGSAPPPGGTALIPGLYSRAHVGRCPTGGRSPRAAHQHRPVKPHVRAEVRHIIHGGWHAVQACHVQFCDLKGAPICPPHTAHRRHSPPIIPIVTDYCTCLRLICCLNSDSVLNGPFEQPAKSNGQEKGRAAPTPCCLSRCFVCAVFVTNVA